jgi:beta-fructofuranosidase
MTEASRQRQQLAHDRYRPGYHFVTPTNWLNDPNGMIQWGTRYHLFYQHNPHAAKWGDIHWGHAYSDDLVHWHDAPIALAPTPGSPDADGCWSGCIVNDNGVPTMIYTGVQNKRHQRPCLATSDDDLLVWRKYEGNPIIAEPPPGFDPVEFRDHCIWQQDGVWYQLIGSGVPSQGGAVLLYRSHNLREWTFLHALCTGKQEESGEIWECPDFFPVDAEQHMLIVSPTPLRKTFYMLGTYADLRFTPTSLRLLDIGGHLYAPQSLRDQQGRRILIGWSWEGRSQEAQLAAGWAGAMTLPRLIDTHPDGEARFTPAPEVQALRGAHQRWEDTHIASNSSYVLEAQGDTLELLITFAPNQAERFGVDVLRSPDGAEFTRIVYDRTNQQLQIDRRTSSSNDQDQHDIHSGDLALPPDQPLTLHIFVDRSIIEVFANNRVCATTRVYPTRRDSLGVAVFAEGGAALVNSIDAWRLATIWPIQSE